jgi:hypothetical protein
MINLGICRRCEHCKDISEGEADESGNPLTYSQAWCQLVGLHVDFSSDVPADCPFAMEHAMTEGKIGDLAEQTEHIKRRLK